MVKRSHCNSSNSGGGHRRSVVVTVSVLALYAVLCGGAVSGTSLGDRTAYYGVAVAAERVDDAAVVAAVAGSTARNGRSATNLSHITGTARKIKMFIKNRYLQVFPDGTVNSTAEDTNDYVILQRTSVNMGQLNIQGVATCMYLCMDACGLLYGSKDFEDECVFNEMIEQNHYNTYSSVKYTNDRRTLYLALNKRGAPRKVQIKADAPLGKLSTYTRVLTQPVPAERVERLLANRRPFQSAEWPASIPHAHRHQHACPPHVGPPHATAKHRKSQGRKCQVKGGGGGRKKNKDDGNRDSGSREDEDCGGGGNKKKNNNRCGDGGDETNHRKVDAAGRKKKSKKPTTGGGKGGKGDKPQRQHGAKAGKKSETDAPPPGPAVAVQPAVTTVVAPSSIVDADGGGGGGEDDDDDDDAAAALAATAPTDEFLHFNDN
ncbi:uncharacterized protein LOC113561007 [Rhopalosiphum maidis]|uniref:uncharacterized protein LOC113561007 n=1 Tax=Rhopalosiphum maidis TaxID=43146 RepID=UPI000F01049C|nr:uncharacterized protein LOC113561007 [Rhopalosiphum maidis]